MRAAAAGAAAFAASVALAFGFAPAGCSSAPRFPACERDDQCTAGGARDYCVDLRCVFCRTSVDCADRQRCRAGACEPDPNAPPPPSPDAGADAEDVRASDEDDAGDVPTDEDDHAPPQAPRRVLPRGIRRFFGP